MKNSLISQSITPRQPHIPVPNPELAAPGVNMAFCWQQFGSMGMRKNRLWCSRRLKPPPLATAIANRSGSKGHTPATASHRQADSPFSCSQAASTSQAAANPGSPAAAPCLCVSVSGGCESSSRLSRPLKQACWSRLASPHFAPGGPPKRPRRWTHCIADGLLTDAADGQGPHLASAHLRRGLDALRLHSLWP